jgi:hypothetical protein
MALAPAAGQINDWTDLRRVFVDNFQGTYKQQPARVHTTLLQALH